MFCHGVFSTTNAHEIMFTVSMAAIASQQYVNLLMITGVDRRSTESRPLPLLSAHFSAQK